MVPFRWLGHRVDLRTIVVDDVALFAAEDVCKALDVWVDHFTDVWENRKLPIFPFPTQRLDGLDVDLITADQVRAIDAARPMYAPDPGFIDWFEQLLTDQLAGDRLEQLVDAVKHPEPGALADKNYSVQKAARILSRDPLIDLGQRRLFEFMQGLGWIARDTAYIWIPSTDALKAGWLYRQHVRITTHKSLYPQVRITPEGLQELHTRLGALGPLQIEEPTHLALVEDL